jgi:Na+/H+ antiporter NhaD/arsenite permease-like protein
MNLIVNWWQVDGAQTVLAFTPFFLLLFLIAVMPYVRWTSHWWGALTHKFIVAVLFAGAGVLLYVHATGDWIKVGETYLDYFSFLILLGSLFTVAGGIHISGAFMGYPGVNTLFLGLGALLSNVLGTLGASMLLIRPLLHANQHRQHKGHIVLFFIFIVSNCAACLIPLGPPLYLGYLRGVPFFWTLWLTAPCALVVGTLLLVFYFCDEHFFEKENWTSKGHMVGELKKAHRKIHIQGKGNLLLLAVMIGGILLAGYVLHPFFNQTLGEKEGDLWIKIVQTLFMVGVAAVSFKTTPRELHVQNRFHFGPLWEVAILFFGIFGAMIPVLAYLEAHGPELAYHHDWEYFWASGLLSAFLDNAPTYLTLTAMASGQHGLSPAHLGELAGQVPQILIAISCGSSFMGALTYIGNGPNFMVKAIAEEAGVEMPSFGGYMIWSGVILIPIFLVVTFIFF